MVAPLLEVRPLPQPPPDLSEVAALAFTSANGVAAFASLSPRRELPVFTVGDATAEAARTAGFADVTSADGALEDLAALLQARTPHSGTVLAPGPRRPAGDLAALASGVRVQPLSVYETVPTDAPAPADLAAVLIHSPRAAQALSALWPIQGTTVRVVAISEPAARALPASASPRVAARPTEATLLEALGKPPPAV